MFQEYQNEIIAAISIITMSIIFLLMRKKTSALDHNTDENQSTPEIVDVSDDTQKNEIKAVEENNLNVEKEIKQEIEIEFEGKEEGSFGEEIDKKTVKSNKKKHKIKKRDVPPHGKITKQNFTEFAGLKLLVAEDNFINQKVITGLLADTGIEITMANDGQEALDILQNSSDFKIILMDVHMPRVDGLEATRIIRANKEYDHIMVVALSGDTAQDDINNMRAAGMEEQLEKPLRMDSLYNILYAYSSTGKEINNDDYIHIVSTKELDGDKGLSICGGDEEFYREILSEFVATYENSTNKLHELLSEGKLKEADKLLLDIIGVTANIGANPLNSIAVNVKDALQDTQEKSYLTLIKQYKLHMVGLLKDIKEYL